MNRVTSSSQLSSVPSASSLSSLASRPSSSELGAPSEPSLTILRTPQEKTADNAEMTMGTSSGQRASPFQSFQSMKTSGPFRPLLRGSGQFHVIATLSIAFLAATAAAAGHSPTNRKLEDESGEWTGEWNGEWQAGDDDAAYECGDNCDDDQTKSDSGMWIESDVQLEGMAAWTAEQIVTYVSVGMLSFMTLLCCVCYPEILIVGYSKMCGCCPGAKAGTGVSRGDAAAALGDEEFNRDYVGGKQGSDKKKKKKRRSSKGGSKSSRSRSRNKDVELV